MSASCLLMCSSWWRWDASAAERGQLAVLVAGLQPCTGFRVFLRHPDSSLLEVTQQAQVLPPMNAAVKLEVQDRRSVW